MIHIPNLTVAKTTPKPTPALTTIINANQSGSNPVLCGIVGGRSDIGDGVLVGASPTPPAPPPIVALGFPGPVPSTDIYSTPVSKNFLKTQSQGRNVFPGVDISYKLPQGTSHAVNQLRNV